MTRRALLSVTDKTGLTGFARSLTSLGFDLVASGGTFRHLSDAGLAVREVSEVTGAPEILGGRVKTLHPAIHGGILARRDSDDHMETLQAQGWAPVDVVVCNLYAFERKVAEGADFATLVENIDIGGVALLRAAAKNHAHVTVICDPEDYGRVAEQLPEVSADLRRALALKAFRHTAHYDATIAAGLAAAGGGLTEWPESFTMAGTLRQPMRYGENPHQGAAFYVCGAEPCSLATAEQLQGKELSYNNLLDADGALGLIREFDEPACAIIKHSNPCGCAIGATLEEAHALARACDPVSAFGGIIAVNRPVSKALAEAIAPHFTEVVLAPDFTEDARAVFAQKKNLRLLRLGAVTPNPPGRVVRGIAGGFLVQDFDTGRVDPQQVHVVTKAQPTEADWRGLLFAWKVVKWVKSNAIVYTSAEATLGIGAGQMSRVDSAKIGATKAAEHGHDLRGSYLGSDAFFPFRDGIDAAAKAGVRAVIQPGGSVRDDEVVAAADEHGLVMVFTGMRHFRH
ncbi:MAG: bifunctional phosphoribosylaminoimidazolecarboxamide formyltransferase/IMP cyclohydrolase [Candidatus Sumerlaeia bacterium]|nr:bifunctional phosphoribosylaminoimidazolecarboxamide formyltransferase/IMP cyclohydrolase [Candidatus Sumerlaeia bacterium]